MKKSIVIILCALLTMNMYAQKKFTATSPDGRVVTTVNLNEKLTYSITHDGQEVLASSPISMTLSNGEVWGEKPQLVGKSSSRCQMNIQVLFSVELKYLFLVISSFTVRIYTIFKQGSRVALVS